MEPVGSDCGAISGSGNDPSADEEEYDSATEQDDASNDDGSNSDSIDSESAEELDDDDIMRVYQLLDHRR